MKTPKTRKIETLIDTGQNEHVSPCGDLKQEEQDAFNKDT